MMLGDDVKRVLESVGITESRVSKWLGRPCNCQKRRERLNRLGAICRRFLQGRIEGAREYITELLNEETT